MRIQFTLKLSAFFILFFFTTNILQAQDGMVYRDTISMEPGRTHDVYYSMQNGETDKVIRDNWDIGFSTAKMDVSIRTNGANGIKLFTYPNAGLDAWNNIDTTGFYTWPVMYNDDTNWENGAFNRNAGSHPDYGWGFYNMTTHTITGDSIYLIQFVDLSLKQIWIVEKNPNEGFNSYTFKYANLDGSDEHEVVVPCNDYAEKNFVGYSITNNELVDREPASRNWDLVFTKYITFYGGVMWYSVTGLMQNYNVQVATYPETDTSFVDFKINDLDSTNISTIGNNWYTLQPDYTYVITDSLVYFVSDRESSIWKLVFEYYESSMGEIGFKKQLIEDHSSISEINSRASGNLAIQPNPANSNTINILFDADEAGLANFSIYTITGAKMIAQSVNYNFGLNNQQIDISKLPTGAYIIMMTSGNVSLTNKLIVQ